MCKRRRMSADDEGRRRGNAPSTLAYGSPGPSVQEGRARRGRGGGRGAGASRPPSSSSKARRGRGPRPEAPPPPGLGQHFAVLVDDLDATIAELRAQGLEVSDASPVAANRQAFVHDPSGNMVELHEAGTA